MRRATMALHLPVLLSGTLACSDVTTIPSADGAHPAAPHRQVTPSCTHHWAAPVAGAWSDSTRWDTGTVPRSGDEVCITVPGAYVVAVDQGYAEHVTVGDGVSSIALIAVNSSPAVSPILGVRTIHVRATALLQLRDLNSIHELETDPGSVVTLGATTSLHDLSSMEISGTLSLPAGRDLYVYFEENARAYFSNAFITGDAHVYLDGDARDPGFVELGSGTYNNRASLPGSPVMVVRGLDLDVNSSSSGAVQHDPHGSAVRLSGSPDQGMTVRVVNSRNGSSLELGYSPMLPLRTRGRVTIENSASGTLAVTANADNNGTLILGPGRVDVMDGAFVNDSTLVIRDSVRVASGLISNAGAIELRGQNADLIFAGGVLVAHPTGSVDREIVLEAGGTLAGNGTLPEVVATGGTVSPGYPLTFPGMLSVGTLTLGGGSLVDLTVAGTVNGSYDRIHVTGSLNLGGTLGLQTVNPFVGGLCGQVIDAVTLAPGASMSGAFKHFQNLGVSATQQWRAVTTTTGISLAGYDPSQLLSLSRRSVGVIEGGAGASASICFNGPGPSAPVVVTTMPQLGQATAGPSPMTVKTLGWALPLPITVHAVDDGVAEPVHRDSLQFALASADPAYRGTASQQLDVVIADNDDAVDLAVSLVTSPDTVALNQVFEARYRVTNNGPASSSGSTFTVAPLAGMTHQGNSQAVTCTPTTGSVSCVVGALAPGAMVEFVLVYRSAAAGSHASTVGITGNEHDRVGSNNSFVWRVTVH